MGLAQVLRSHRVVVCVGSGGVGKTTTSAALALHAALSGKRVLCLTIDPAKRLAQSLGLSEMRAEEQVVPKELFDAAGLTCPGSLSAMMLDAKRTFDDLVTKHARSDAARDRILRNELYQYISTSLAGTQEYMAMEKLHAVKDDPRYDLVVLDTPPTTNALDFLDAPERLVGAIDSPAMRWFVEAFEGAAGKMRFSLAGRGASFLLKGLARFTGGEFLDAVAQFVIDLNELFGGFRERAQQVSSALRSDNVAFVVVTSPMPLASSEALFFTKRLSAGGLRQRGLVINRVHPVVEPPVADDATLTSLLERAAPELRHPDELLNRLKKALEDDRTVAVAEQREIERLEERAGTDVARVRVPEFDTDVHDLRALADVARHLCGEAA